MFRSTRDADVTATSSSLRARGGVLFGPIITGVLVAFGAMFLLSALIAGILAATGYLDEAVSGEILEASLGAGIAIVIAQFIAYLWGGYTAGRMSRGAGFANGFLVPVVAILLGLGVWAISAALGATVQINLPFTASRLPVDSDLLIEWGPAAGIAALVAMFLGGILGGLMGVRWHSKLETIVLEESRPGIGTEDPIPPGPVPTTQRTEDGRPIYVGRE